MILKSIVYPDDVFIVQTVNSITRHQSYATTCITREQLSFRYFIQNCICI